MITGMSGAGRSTAAACLDDLGWFVIDNLPITLFEKVAELASGPSSSIGRVALVIGRRVDEAGLLAGLRQLRSGGHRVRVVFLDASDPELVRRYGSSRRRHPLSEDEALGLTQAIARERVLLEPVKSEADLVIDTTELNLHQLKARLVDLFGAESTAAGMQTTLVSFGFKHGVPLDADLVLDCRFLPNPFWDERLRPLSGMDPAVRDFVLSYPVAGEFLARVEPLLDLLLPAYAAEGKTYVTVALGCTGGRHRSVAIAEELARRLRRAGMAPRVQHRDIDR